MNNNIYIHGTNIISSLGFTTEENFDGLIGNNSGIKSHFTGDVYGNLPLALIDKAKFDEKFANEIIHKEEYSFFEKIMLWSAYKAIANSEVNVNSPKTVFVISSTKGNIEYLNPSGSSRKNDFQIWKSANKIADFFNNTNKPIVVSNACVSGVMAIGVASELIDSGVYDSAVVIGADVVSDFIISGFMSFHALSKKACKPFDKKRDGLSLGEAAGCIVLSREKFNSELKVVASSNSNDANHISGPSRTGEGLSLAINKALKEAKLTPEDIDFISAHGTATIYNDEMESIAINSNNLQSTNINSFKGYWGHTLGASGLIETIASIESLRRNILIKSLGYSNTGTSIELNMIEENTEKNINVALKTSAGFGGVNSVVIVIKE